MIISELKNNIYALSLSIPEMRFEGMWDLPHGVTLNSYILKGDKLAIIDGAIGWNGSEDSIFTGMKRLDIDPNDVDYLIVNHMEPDHSGWISEFKKYNDHFKVITTLKGSQMVKAFYGEDVNIMIVKEGDSLDLGKNLLLTFHPVPNVHWPETMYTFENNSKTLFSCDMFGAFGILDTSIFYDELSNEETKIFELETIRYFSNVLTTFSSMVEKAIRKAEDLNVETIATGHGPIYRSNPKLIIDFYNRLCKYAKGYGQDVVTVLWGSMYGLTETMVNHVVEFLRSKGKVVNSIRVPESTESDIVTSIFKSSAIILAMPTYEYKMFPPMAHALDEIGRKRIVNKLAFRFGSYGWSGGAEKELLQILDTHKMNWDFMESHEFEGSAKLDDFTVIEGKLNQLIEKMISKTI